MHALLLVSAPLGHQVVQTVHQGRGLASLPLNASTYCIPFCLYHTMLLQLESELWSAMRKQLFLSFPIIMTGFGISQSHQCKETEKMFYLKAILWSDTFCAFGWTLSSNTAGTVCARIIWTARGFPCKQVMQNWVLWLQKASNHSKCNTVLRFRT